MWVTPGFSCSVEYCQSSSSFSPYPEYWFMSCNTGQWEGAGRVVGRILKGHWKEAQILLTVSITPSRVYLQATGDSLPTDSANLPTDILTYAPSQSVAGSLLVFQMVVMRVSFGQTANEHPQNAGSNLQAWETTNVSTCSTQNHSRIESRHRSLKILPREGARIVDQDIHDRSEKASKCQAGMTQGISL